ncbi:MAG: hypothetical protein IJR46_07050 [Neisseriaceae bacterium]|nr:hypothetical protein [Neisseriaceae bacterium]
MQITYSEKLKQYMQQKNLTHIEISVVEPSGCCMGFSEIVVNFVNEKDMPKLKGKILRTLTGEIGDILITSRGVELDDTIHFDLKNFLGVKDINVTGAHAWKI